MTRLGTSLFPSRPLGNFSGRKVFAFPRTYKAFTAPGPEIIFGRPKGSFSGRGAFSGFSRGASIPFTRLGTRVIPQGRLGNFAGKPIVQPTIVSLPVGHFAGFTPKPFSLLQDTVVNLPSASDKSFTGGNTFQALQGGSLVQLTTAHLTYTPSLSGTGFSVFQSNPGDHTVFLPTANLTFTPKPFSVVYQNTVQLPTGHMTVTGIPFDIAITLPGPQTLTQTDILAIWNNISVSGYSPQVSLELVLAALMGRLNGAGIQTPGQIQIMDASGQKVVITAQVDESGNRLQVILTP